MDDAIYWWIGLTSVFAIIAVLMLGSVPSTVRASNWDALKAVAWAGALALVIVLVFSGAMGFYRA